MKVITWNVNGLRARWAEVNALVAANAPDVLCLQEIKATAAQVPEPLTGLPDYWNTWHGGPGGYSGVSVHVRRERCPTRPAATIPPFDFENRIATVDVGRVTLASVYVPNGAKDHRAKLAFLDGLAAWLESRGPGANAIVCGDLNVALTPGDVHPSMRNEGAIGQRDSERERLQRAIDTGLVDLVRAQWPKGDDVFTWWPPWRDEKAKNHGWRIDFVLASRGIAWDHVEVLSSFGTSDHAPVLAEVEVP